MQKKIPFRFQFLLIVDKEKGEGKKNGNVTKNALVLTGRRKEGRKEKIKRWSKRSCFIDLETRRGREYSAGQVKCVGFSYCCRFEAGHEKVLARERIGKGRRNGEE